MDNARQAPGKKGLTNFLMVCYNHFTSNGGFIFCAFLREAYENSELPGGAVMRVKNYTSLHRVQTAQLQHDEKQEE